MGIEIDVVKRDLKDSFKKITPEILFDQIDLNKALRDQVEIDSLDYIHIIILLQKKPAFTCRIQSFQSLIH